MGLGDKLKPGSFVRSTAILAGGAAAGQLVAVLASPIVSRLYTPTEVGVQAVFLNIFTFIAPVACLRYDSALSLPKDDVKAARLLVACLASTVLMALVVLGLVAGFGPWVANALRAPNAAPFLWVMPVSVLGVGVYQTFSYWAIRHRQFALTGKTRVVQGTAQAVFQIALGLLKVGPIGLIAGDVANRVSGAGTIAALAWRQHRSALSQTTGRDVLAAAKEYSVFPLYSGPAALLHTATTVFTLVLQPMYGTAVNGLYFFSFVRVWGPVSLVGQAMAQVYLAEASRWSRDDPVKMLRSFDRIVKRLALIGIVPFAVLTAFGGPIVGFVFGRPYFESGVYVQIQAVSWWTMFVVGPVLNTLNILKRQKWQLWADATGVALMAAGFYFSWKNGWSPRIAIGLYSVVITLMYGWLYLACRRAIVLAVQSPTPVEVDLSSAQEPFVEPE